MSSRLAVAAASSALAVPVVVVAVAVATVERSNSSSVSLDTKQAAASVGGFGGPRSRWLQLARARGYPPVGINFANALFTS